MEDSKADTSQASSSSCASDGSPAESASTEEGSTWKGVRASTDTHLDASRRRGRDAAHGDDDDVCSASSATSFSLSLSLSSRPGIVERTAAAGSSSAGAVDTAPSTVKEEIDLLAPASLDTELDAIVEGERAHRDGHDGRDKQPHVGAEQQLPILKRLSKKGPEGADGLAARNESETNELAALELKCPFPRVVDLGRRSDGEGGTHNARDGDCDDADCGIHDVSAAECSAETLSGNIGIAFDDGYASDKATEGESAGVAEDGTHALSQVDRQPQPFAPSDHAPGAPSGDTADHDEIGSIPSSSKISLEGGNKRGEEEKGSEPDCASSSETACEGFPSLSTDKSKINDDHSHDAARRAEDAALRAEAAARRAAASATKAGVDRDAAELAVAEAEAAATAVAMEARRTAETAATIRRAADPVVPHDEPVVPHDERAGNQVAAAAAAAPAQPHAKVHTRKHLGSDHWESLRPTGPGMAVPPAVVTKALATPPEQAPRHGSFGSPEPQAQPEEPLNVSPPAAEDVLNGDEAASSVNLANGEFPSLETSLASDDRTEERMLRLAHRASIAAKLESLAAATAEEGPFGRGGLSLSGTGIEQSGHARIPGFGSAGDVPEGFYRGYSRARVVDEVVRDEPRSGNAELERVAAVVAAASGDSRMATTKGGGIWSSPASIDASVDYWQRPVTAAAAAASAAPSPSVGGHPTHSSKAAKSKPLTFVENDTDPVERGYANGIANSTAALGRRSGGEMRWRVGEDVADFQAVPPVAMSERVTAREPSQPSPPGALSPVQRPQQQQQQWQNRRTTAGWPEGSQRSSHVPQLKPNTFDGQRDDSLNLSYRPGYLPDGHYTDMVDDVSGGGGDGGHYDYGDGNLIDGSFAQRRPFDAPKSSCHERHQGRRAMQGVSSSRPKKKVKIKRKGPTRSARPAAVTAAAAGCRVHHRHAHGGACARVCACTSCPCSGAKKPERLTSSASSSAWHLRRRSHPVHAR